MFHCHNLIHEDHDMMAAFNVTMLEDFGYNETTNFFDPMDPRWRAVPYNRADFTARTGAFSSASITARVEELARQQPYSELEEVEDALDAYWDEHGAGNPNSPRSAAPVAPAPEASSPKFRRFTV
jgi:bilirubin oxidase